MGNTEQNTGAPLVSMREITKRFPGVLALDGVSMDVYPGEVLALTGENGAGKSTLMKILSGIYPADSGRIEFNGSEESIRSVADARRLGIALIHQELMLAPNLDVAGNIFLGAEHRKPGFPPRLDSRSMHGAAEKLLARVGLSVPSSTLVRNLKTGQQQMVEIAKALSFDARLIIMDEPTSSLSCAESEKLFEVVDSLKKSGIAVVYISHRMEEILRITDRVVVLRDGKNAGVLETKRSSHKEIVSLMIGRDYDSWFPAREQSAGKTIFSIQSLIVPGTGESISFDVKEGEILGFAGLVGSGRTELMETLFGITPPEGGAMVLDGVAFLPANPAQAISRGVYLVPEDRKANGLVLGMSVAENISLPDIANYRPHWVLQRKKEKEVAETQKAKLSIKARDVNVSAVTLSGGNQQKIVLGKWLAMKPRVLILDEPTRGIDVNAKSEIYRHITKLADSGVAVIMTSSEMEEILRLSDRVVVMRESRISGILERESATEEAIALLMTGAPPLTKAA
jgi:ribose transport system ATP-binding protein